MSCGGSFPHHQSQPSRVQEYICTIYYTKGHSVDGSKTICFHLPRPGFFFCRLGVPHVPYSPQSLRQPHPVRIPISRRPLARLLSPVVPLLGALIRRGEPGARSVESWTNTWWLGFAKPDRPRFLSTISVPKKTGRRSPWGRTWGSRPRRVTGARCWTTRYRRRCGLPFFGWYLACLPDVISFLGGLWVLNSVCYVLFLCLQRYDVCFGVHLCLVWTLNYLKDRLFARTLCFEHLWHFCVLNWQSLLRESFG